MIDIEEDTPEAKLIGEYLDLVDGYGASHPKTQLFLDVHADCRALREWSAGMVEMEQTDKRRRLYEQVALAVMTLLAVAAMCAVWPLLRFTP